MASGFPTRYMFVDCAIPQKSKARTPHASNSGVRAHITKEFHRRLRVRRLAAFKSDGKVASISNPESTENLEEVEEVEEIDSGSGARYESNVMSRAVADKCVRSILGQGRIDPFDCLPIHRMPAYEHQILDHALVHSWPDTLPAKGNMATHPVKRAWLQCAMEHPVIFHAFLWAAALHLVVAHKGNEIMQSAASLRLAHQTATIRLVYQHISDLNGAPPSDALVMAVTTLAVHGTPDTTEYPQCHPVSPLAKQQQLHVYGKIRHAAEHIPALRALIEQKGGIGALETYGFTDTLTIADIYFASKYVTAPSFPLQYDLDSLVASGWYVMDATAIELDSELGSGFKYLRSSVSGRLLLEALELMCEITTALDQHERHAAGAPDLCDLTQARNIAQHKMLSLRLDEEEVEIDTDSSAVQLCRLAALIYSDMVLLPLPPVQEIKPRLARMMHQILEDQPLKSTIHNRLLLWMTLMGCIATSFGPEQIWFLQQLQFQTLSLQIQDWPTLQALCCKFLWWSPVCDEPGLRVWTEMLTKLSFDSDFIEYS